MCTPELGTFVEQFTNLWKSGYEAHLDAHTYAGEAWVHLHVRLGQAQVNHLNSSLSRNRNGPARERRRSRRAAERATKTSNSSILPSAEEAASKVIVSNEPPATEPELVKNICVKKTESEVDDTEKEDISDDEKVHDATVQPDLAEHRAEQSRPKRDRKRNVRYNSEEYDLSAVSSGVGLARMKLSGIHAHSNAGQLTQGSRKIRKI